MVRRQTIEIKSVSLQQSLSKLKQRGVDLVKDSTGLEAGLDCRPGRFAAAQGRQSHPASRPVSSLTRSTPLCFSLARLVLRSPFLFYGLSPDHKKVVFGFWSLISATLNFFSSLQFCKKDACGSPNGTDQQNSVLWSVEGRKNSLVSSQTEKLRFWVFSDFFSGIGGQFQSFLTPWKSIMVVKVTKSLHSQLIKRVQ